MKAMILAAGKGERMRPLTYETPKPLLSAGGKPLIVHHIEQLADSGFREIVINTAHLGAKIHATLRTGSRWGVRISYSHEGLSGLETAGGMNRALPLLGKQPFLTINADIWTDYPLEKLKFPITGLAHLVLTRNPEHNPQGDFFISPSGVIENSGEAMHTYTGIAVLSPSIFDKLPIGTAKLAPLLRNAASKEKVSGELYLGAWDDIGTPERLEALDKRLRDQGLRTCCTC
ncbi:MAG: N-acetylmuramate alpha-1-phosphate uridylyltransferase MurU [Pseudomonadota bacterium]